MKKLLTCGLVLILSASTTWASGLNLRAVSDSSNMITVAPGATVNFEILGLLTDTSNQGLALFGFDVVFSGGTLAQITPTATVMSFVSPDGIGNPAGFGGTTTVPGREGDLVQVGGAQNTINNVSTNAPFPIGLVVMNIGQTEVALATGSLIAPAGAGVYTLQITNGFANVIKLVQPMGIDFMTVEEATPVSGSSLTITVQEACVAQILSSTLPECAIDARQNSAPDGTSPRGIDRFDITLTCEAASVLAGDFVVTSSAGVAPTVTDIVANGVEATIVFSSVIPVGAWTCVEIGGTSHCVGALPSDVDNNGTAAAADLNSLMDCLTGLVTCEAYQCDVDDSGTCGAGDILRAIDLQNGAETYDVWAGATLGACPSIP